MPKGRCAFLEKQHHGFHARSLKGAAGAVEHGMQVAAFQQQFAQGNRGVVGVGEEGVLDYLAHPATGLEHLDEVLLDFLALLAAEGRIGEDHVHAVLVLDVGKLFGQSVGKGDVGRLDAVQNQVHDRDDVSQ